MMVSEIQAIACDEIESNLTQLRDAKTPPEIQYWLTRIICEAGILDKFVKAAVAAALEVAEESDPE